MTHTTTAAIDAADVARYHADGFLVVRQVFSGERIRELAADADQLFSRIDLIDPNNVRCRWQNHAVTGECRFDCFDPVIDLSPAMARMSTPLKRCSTR